MADLQAMLEQANVIVQQQRSQVQDALLRWRRSSGGGSSSTTKLSHSPRVAESTDGSTAAADAAVVAAQSSDSQLQLCQLQHQQQQLLNELGRLSHNDSEMSVVQRLSSAVTSASQSGQSEAASSEAGSVAPAAAASLQLPAAAMPEEITAYVKSLAARLMAMQSITEHITTEVLAKHQEAVALQASFIKVIFCTQAGAAPNGSMCGTTIEHTQVMHAAEQWHNNQRAATVTTTSPS